MEYKFDESPKRKKAKKDPNAPKKPTNAFLYFAAETHRELQSYVNFRLRVAETTSHAADLWKKMTAESKGKYVEMARVDKIRYRKEMADYFKKKRKAASAALKKDEDEEWTMI